MSSITVVLVSSRTDNAYYEREEIAAAIDMARRDQRKHRAVPVYLDDVQNQDTVPYGLRLKHTIVASSSTGLARVARELLALLHKINERAISAPTHRSQNEPKKTSLRVTAKGSGRLVNWQKFKQGELVDQSRLAFSHSTVLTDVISGIYSQCKTLDSNCKLKVLFPNGYTSASFDLVIEGNGFEVVCGRRLVRGFPWNPLAAEFGENYDVLVSIIADDFVANQLINNLRSNYSCS